MLIGASPALNAANIDSRYSGQFWRYWATLSCSWRAGVEQEPGDAVGAPVELAPEHPPVALHLALRVGDLPGDDLPRLGEVPTRHLVSPWFGTDSGVEP